MGDSQSSSFPSSVFSAAHCAPPAAASCVKGARQRLEKRTGLLRGGGGGASNDHTGPFGNVNFGVLQRFALFFKL